MVVQKHSAGGSGNYFLFIPMPQTKAVSEQIDFYNEFREAVETVDLSVDGNLFDPKIKNYSFHTGEELTLKQLEERIYDFGANLWVSEKHQNLVSKLEDKYGSCFLEELSPEYKKIVLEEEAQKSNYVEQGLLEAEARRDYVWTEEGVKHLEENPEHNRTNLDKKLEEKFMSEGKIASVVTTKDDIFEYKFTSNGRRFLNENPDKNPELRNLTGYRTPKDTRKNTWLRRVGSGIIVALFGGAAGAIAKNAFHKTPAVYPNAVLNSAYDDGNNSTGILSGSFWPSPPNHIYIYLTAQDTNDPNNSITRYLNVPTGAKLNNVSVTPQAMSEQLDWTYYAFQDLQNNILEQKGMLAVLDDNNDSTYDNVIDLGVVPNYTYYQPIYNNTPTVTNVSLQNGTWTFTKDGKEFYAKGINFKPLHPGWGGYYNWMENASNYQKGLEEIANISANSITVSSPRNMEDGFQFLDAAHEAGLDVYIDLSSDWTDWTESGQDAMARAVRVVGAYRNHSAVVGWDIGVYDGSNFINDTLAPLVKQLDPNHVVRAQTDYTNFDSADQDLGAIDILNVNLDNSEFTNQFWSKAKNASHPIMISHGAGSQINQTIQAQEIQSQLEDILNNTGHFTRTIFGDFVLSWTDQHDVSNPRENFGDSYLDPIESENMGLTKWLYDSNNSTWKTEQKLSAFEVARAFDQFIPIIYFTNSTPVNNTNQTKNFINARVIAKDDTSINKLAISLRNATGFAQEINTSTRSVGLNTTELAANFTGLNPGIYDLSAWAKDNVDNKNSTENRTIIIYHPIENNTTSDTLAPVIYFATPPTPANNSNLSQDFIRSKIVAVDETSLAEIVARFFNSTGALIYSQNSSASPLEMNVSNLVDGIYYENASARDASGNANSTETRMFTIYHPPGNGTGNNTNQDVTPPTVRFLPPTPKNRSVIPFSILPVHVKARDDKALEKVYINLTDSFGVMQSSKVSKRKNTLTLFTKVPNGLYDLNATAIDKAGNSDSVNRFIKVCKGCSAHHGNHSHGGNSSGNNSENSSGDNGTDNGTHNGSGGDHDWNESETNTSHNDTHEDDDDDGEKENKKNDWNTFAYYTDQNKLPYLAIPVSIGAGGAVFYKIRRSYDTADETEEDLRDTK